MSCGCEVSIDNEKRKATIYIPVDAKLVQDIEAGDEVTVTIKGKVIGGHFRLKREDWEDSNGNLDVEIDSISVDGKNAFQQLID